MRKTKFLATVLVIALLISSMAVFAPKTFAFSNATLKTGDDGQITITRNVNDVTNPVTNTFTYTIAQHKHADTEPTAVSFPTSATVVFDGDEAIVSGTATSTGIIDFSTAQFNELGDYHFVITETASTDATTYPLDSKKYDLIVSVRNVFETGSTTPTGTTLVYTVADQAYTYDSTTGEVTGTKADVVFESNSEHTYIELTKNVTGNLARKDEYFPFTITFDDDRLAANDEFVLLGDYSYSTTKPVLKAGQSNVIYLKHGETVTIGINEDDLKQIPVGVSYKIVEGDTGVNHTYETYKTFIDTSTTDNKTAEKTTVATDADTFNTANKTTYVNDRDADPITGIFFNIMPYVLLVAVAIFGIVLIKKSKKEEE